VEGVSECGGRESLSAARSTSSGEGVWREGVWRGGSMDGGSECGGLSPFIKKAHFHSLTIKRMVLAVEGAQNIIDAFLSSPALHRQTLCFERSSVIGEPSEGEPARKLPMHTSECKEEEEVS